MSKLMGIAAGLVLASAAAAFAQAPGSYRQSCTNIQQSGSDLNAVCVGAGGRSFATSIDVSQCQGQGIANVSGRLACGNVRGSARPVARDEGFGQNGGIGTEGRRRPRNPDQGFGEPDRGGYGSDTPRRRRSFGSESDQGNGYAPIRRRRPLDDNSDQDNSD